MELTAIILSSIALVLSMASITWLLAKQLSSHTITYAPLEQELANQNKQVTSFVDQFKEIGDRSPKPKPIGDDT